jgi:hypothetical protein
LDFKIETRTGVLMSPKHSWLRIAGYCFSLLALCFVRGSASDSPATPERIARFDGSFQDLTYDGVVFIDDAGDACRYRLPHVKVVRNDWHSPVTREVTLDELQVVVAGGEPSDNDELLRLSHSISASFPQVHSTQELAPLEFTIPKHILKRAAYIAFGTVGSLTIRYPGGPGVSPDGVSRTSRASWPMDVPGNRIVNHPVASDPGVVQISSVKPLDPNDVCSSRKIR